jgi:hypothetical protein
MLKKAATIQKHQAYNKTTCPSASLAYIGCISKAHLASHNEPMHKGLSSDLSMSHMSWITCGMSKISTSRTASPSDVRQTPRVEVLR